MFRDTQAMLVKITNLHWYKGLFRSFDSDIPTAMGSHPEKNIRLFHVITYLIFPYLNVLSLIFITFVHLTLFKK